MTWSRAAGLALGHVADRWLADPHRGHPVAGFGRVAGVLETRLNDRTRTRGVVFCAMLVGGLSVAGVALERMTSRAPLLHTVATATVTWAVLGGTSLDREAAAVEALLRDAKIPAARRGATHLVGRETSRLDADEIARAVVESLAENTSDAVVAPLLLGATGGMGALTGYRAANTLDAMVGHRSPRYEQFGWAAARLDDVLNLPGSRVTALLAAIFAPSVDGSPGAALRAWRRDAPGHPSPNAGPVEASFAGALGVRLGGENTYHGRIERRATLGDGRQVETADIARARVLAHRVDVAAVAVSLMLAAASGRRPRHRQRQDR